jgi:DNA-binding CsgD family transcriptional regulator/tetratricopeptide (TPR) repeat protein
MELVERQAALQTLRTLLGACTQRGHVALVAGEAGIGKTSLVRALAEGHDPVWWGACDALETPHPLAPLLDIAREQQVRFARQLGGPRAALFESVLDELRLATKPVLVVMEDVHWGDEATLDLVKFLGRRIERARALLVLTFRDDEVGPAHPLRRVTGELPAHATTRIELAPLSPQAVETVARRALRAPAGLHAATQGNPFFLSELLRHPEQSLPRSVQDLVLARFARLDPPAQAIVRLAAVVPGRLERWLLEEILGPDLPAMEACLHCGLLLADSASFSFRHELARVAVESALPQPVAQSLHAQVLKTLEGSGRAIAPARLAHHAALAADSDAVARYAPLAAADARKQGAHREAARHLRTALRLAPAASEGERRGWLEAYALDSGNVDWHGEAIQARRALEDLYRRSADRLGEAGNLSRLALLYAYMLRNREAAATSRRAVELLEELPPGPALATAYGVEASLRLLDRDIDQAIAWSHKAVDVAQQHGDRQRLCYSRSTLGMALMFRDAQAGSRELEDALAQARAEGFTVAAANALLNLGSGFGELLQVPSAVRWLQEAIAFAREHELDGIEHYCSAWLALCELHQGSWEQAAARAGAIVARPESWPVVRFTALLALGQLRVRRGEPGADEALDAALSLAGAGDSLQRIAPVRAARAEAAYARGDCAGAVAEAQSALPLAVQRQHPWFAGELAYWCWRAGALDTPTTPCAEPYALQIAGDWRGAAAAWQALGCSYERARALEEGDEDAQREALAVFEALGARAKAQVLRRRLQGEGVRGLPRGVRNSTRGNAFGLTGRELQVLQLLCEGLRNAEIAQRLSRSVRTVDNHVASVFAKLGVETRLAAIQAAQRAGLDGQSG